MQKHTRLHISLRHSDSHPTAVQLVAMAGARDGMRALRAVSGRQLSQQVAKPCARRFASSSAAAQNPLANVEESTSFSTPGPDEKTAKAFHEARASSKRDKQLPGGR